MTLIGIHKGSLMGPLQTRVGTPEGTPAPTVLPTVQLSTGPYFLYKPGLITADHTHYNFYLNIGCDVHIFFLFFFSKDSKVLLCLDPHVTLCRATPTLPLP